MNDVMLQINLFPGVINDADIEKLLDLCINKYKWILPAKYGHIDADIKISGDKLEDYQSKLLNTYKEYNDLIISKGNNYLIIYPDKNGFAGDVFYSNTNYSTKFKSKNIIQEVRVIMNFLNSPIAVSGTYEMYNNFLLRDVERDGKTQSIVTVKNYSYGLTNAFWRMWFGKDYINFFGKDKLDQTPAFYKEYKDNIYFIQLFESPYDWNTPEGLKIKEDFKKIVGENAFYDPKDPERLLTAPDFKRLYT